MEPVCEVKISYDAREVKKAISCYCLRVRKIRVMMVIVYAVLLAACVIAVVVYESWVLAGFFVLVGGMVQYWFYQRPMEGYRKFYASRKGGVYRFEDDEVSVVGDEVRSQFKWSVFMRAYEVPTAFLLVDTNWFVYVFPKSCFADAQMDALRGLLKEKFSGFRAY